MRGKRAKELRRLAYGERKTWTQEGYFPCHPSLRQYTVMKTYQTMVPKLIRTDLDGNTSAPITVLPGSDGHKYNYRYVPFVSNGSIFADMERRQYRAYKYWWKKKGIISRRLKK